MDQRLSDGDRVCIVGCRPGDSSAALHLLDQAEKHGLHLNVLIFEPRDCTQPITCPNRLFLQAFDCSGVTANTLWEVFNA